MVKAPLIFAAQGQGTVSTGDTICEAQLNPVGGEVSPSSMPSRQEVPFDVGAAVGAMPRSAWCTQTAAGRSVCGAFRRKTERSHHRIVSSLQFTNSNAWRSG